MRFINNWVTELTADLPAGTAGLPIDSAWITRLGLVEGDEYLLTLVRSLDPLQQDAAERILVSGGSGGAVVVLRGQDGSTAQDWAEGDYVFCSITASQAEAWSTPASSGGVPNLQLQIAAAGSYDFDVAVHASLKVLADSGVTSVKLPRMQTSGHYAGFDFYLRGFGGSNIIELLPSDEFGAAAIVGVNTTGTGISIVETGSGVRIVGLDGLLLGRAAVDEYSTILYVYLQL